MPSGGPEQKAATYPLENILVVGKTPVLDELPSDVRLGAVSSRLGNQQYRLNTTFFKRSAHKIR